MNRMKGGDFISGSTEHRICRTVKTSPRIKDLVNLIFFHSLPEVGETKLSVALNMMEVFGVETSTFPSHARNVVAMDRKQITNKQINFLIIISFLF